jgi:hypothetical protein
MQKTIVGTLLLVLLSWTSDAFVVAPAHRAVATLKAVENNKGGKTPSGDISFQWKAAAFTAFVAVSQHPLVALAEEVDDYEYGAVSAPSFVPIVGGLLAILTALLPIALRGGEEAFEEMKESGSFGKGKDVLKSNKKK